MNKFRNFLRTRSYLLALWLRTLFDRHAAPSRVEFVNIGEGTHEHGEITLFPLATTTLGRYLLWTRTAGTFNCAIAGANAVPIGASDDCPDNASYLTQGIAVKIFGAVRGTVRVVTDGTLTDGGFAKCGANGQATAWTHAADSGTNARIGTVIISPDATANAGDVVELIPCLPNIYG